MTERTKGSDPHTGKGGPPFGGPGGPGPGGGPPFSGPGGPGGPFFSQMASPPLAEFLRFPTEDRMLLHGLLWLPAKSTKTVLIYAPGMHGNFCSPHDFNPFVKTIIDKGYAVLAMNFRTGAMPTGLVFGRFEDCVKDLEAAVRFLKYRGFTDIILVGDSLGGPRVTYFWVETHEPSVRAIVFLGSVTSPYLEAQFRWNEQERTRYDAFLQGARDLVAQGKGQEILTYPAWFPNVPLTLSAQTFVNIFGTPEETNACTTKFGARVTIPALVLHGAQDMNSIPANGEAIYKSLTAAPRRDVILVESGHFFITETEAIKYGEALTNWLMEFVPPNQ